MEALETTTGGKVTEDETAVKLPLVVSYGGGVDSTAMLVGLWREGIRPDVILIAAAGLPVPGKSSCFFCPAMTRDEVRELAKKHPNLLRRAIAMEKNNAGGRHVVRRLAEGKKVTVKGLGRRAGTWEAWAIADKMLPEYGGAPDAVDATDAPTPEAAAWLAAREILS